MGLTISGLNLLLDQLVFLGELLGLLDHSVDLFLAQSALVVLDGDGLRLASSLVGGGDLEDTIGIELESDLDLWNTTWCWWNAGKFELSEKVVVLGHGTFTLDCINVSIL